MLPLQARKELTEHFSLSAYDADVLVAEPAYVRFFYSVVEGCNNPKSASNWITSELFGALNRDGKEFSDCPVSAEHLGKLISLVDAETISGKQAKTVFDKMYENGESPDQIVESLGLKQITDDNEIRSIVVSVFEEFPEQLADFLGGNERVHGFFVGQVMKKTGGNANPKKVNEIIGSEKAKRGSDG